ncbi:hypothetical protein BHE74_00055408 [Ensete ventricosum]|nr:hypothetical protein GW17_00050108 [Ensete ventricosum]RWW39278.1 hypothetical protein BHE74_00055408 [Ensete ventricosum]RZS22781.1 hypothetical protein BHM03_00055605 [Ensete ventricosum]
MKTLVLSDEHLVVGARGNPKKYATYSEGANNEGDQKDGVSFEGMLASNHGINYLFLFYKMFPAFKNVVSPTHNLLTCRLTRQDPHCRVRYLPHPRPTDNCMAKITKLNKISADQT